MAVGRPKYAPRRDAEAVAVAMDTGAVLSARRRFAGGLWKLCLWGELWGNVFGNVRMRHAVISSPAKAEGYPMKASGQGRAVGASFL